MVKEISKIYSMQDQTNHAVDITIIVYLRCSYFSKFERRFDIKTKALPMIDRLRKNLLANLCVFLAGAFGTWLRGVQGCKDLAIHNFVMQD